MPIAIPYLFKLFVSLSLIYLFYLLILRRLTFYNANRWYLFLMTFVSFLVPFIRISPTGNSESVNENLFRFIPSVQHFSIGLEEATQCPEPLWSSNWNKWDWILLFVFVIAAVLLIHFFFRLFSFYQMRRKAKLVTEANGCKIYEVNDQIIPFSFGDSIFINNSQHTETELRDIISHEFVHVRQHHTIDIMWAEFLCIVNWYNPVAWLVRKDIRQNLEFIADQKVLDNGINKKEYQYLLLKVIGNNQYSIAPKFNFSSLKKRIAMMNKRKTTRIHLLRFLLLLPVLAVILISFREQLTAPLPNQQLIFKDTIPEVTTPNAKGFIINIRDSNGSCLVEVKDRNGNIVEKVLLTVWNDNPEGYEKKYGKIPPPPPSKPGQPPLPPKNISQPPPPPTPPGAKGVRITSTLPVDCDEKKDQIAREVNLTTPLDVSISAIAPSIEKPVVIEMEEIPISSLIMEIPITVPVKSVPEKEIKVKEPSLEKSKKSVDPAITPYKARPAVRPLLIYDPNPVKDHC